MADQTWRRAIPLVVLLGCNGAIGGSGGPDGNDPFTGPGASDVGVIGAQVMHRLNQTEYRNTTRDLLGTQLDPAGNFPADDVSFGFDNIAQVLTVSPLQFELYEHTDGQPNSLGHNDITTMLLDGEGFLWIGTEGGGLDRFDPRSQRFTHYQAAENDPYGLGSNFVTALYQDSEGTLWIGTADAGLDRFDSSAGQFIHHRHNPNHVNSLGSNSVTAIHQDPFGRLWIGTRERWNVLSS